MKRLLTTLTAAAVAAALAVALAGPAPASYATPSDVTLDGVTVKMRKGTTQVVTVNRTKGYHARVTLWRLEKGTWRKRLRARDGRIGYNGLVRPRKRVQGSGKTPLGTFRLPRAFGMHRKKAGWDDSYRRVRKGDYWVLDNQSDHYNQWRNKKRGGFRWWLGPSSPNASERLKDYPKQYEWAVVTSFNNRQVKHRGGAIFLHVNGRGATAGCVSAPRWWMKKLMFRLDQQRKPLIAIGR